MPEKCFEMPDSRIVTSPCADAIASFAARSWAAMPCLSFRQPPPRLLRSAGPKGEISPFGTEVVLLVDRLGLILGGQLRREIDGTRKVLAALDRVRLARHRILEDRSLEDFLLGHL